MNIGIWTSVKPYFLDNFPGATAAFSLRRLNRNYSGNCIRVRRSSDNTEQDIGFANGVLNESALTSFVGAGNGFVTTWYDQSGNVTIRNATQATQANQPQIVVSGVVNKQGSFPALLFDTTDTLAYSYPTSGATSNDVFYVNYATGTTWIFHAVAGGPFGYVAQSGSTSTLLTNGYGTPSLYVNGTLRTPVNRNNVYSFYNGVFALTTVLNCNLSAVSWATSRISGYGSGFNFAGNALEFIIYNTTNSTNRADKETNINRFYSLY